jgi:hypothetical protein
MKGNNRGFVLALTVVVLFAFAGLVLLFFLSRVISPQGGPSTAGTGTGLSGKTFSLTPTGSSGPSGTNPLLNFNYGVLGSGSTGTGRSVPNTDGTSGSSTGGVTLSLGTASSAVQTYEEYVVIRNSGKPVNITGWTLTNSKGTRPIESSQNSYVYPVADSATIGQGTEFLSPDGRFQTGPIILKTGDTAIVTTGGPFISYPFAISTSFRENICTGYLKDYPFYPAMTLQCPYPTDDPAIRTVTDECFDYLRSANRCEDPQKEDKTGFDKQTTACKTFILQRFNYGSCVTDNRNIPGFSTNQWRVFLGKPRQLWASQRETITLYDAKGAIITQATY